VDFLSESDEVVGLIETINLKYGFWETPAALSEFALERIEALGLAADSPDGT
jgi:hypothetical protein